MTDPVAFPTTTARHALPMLFAGQAQKEFTVNAACARIDLLLHPAIEGVQADPPASPDDGECWLVASGATGAFAGHDGSLAGRQAGTWVFAEPTEGLRAYDRGTGQWLHYAGMWHRAEAPLAPAGGATVDAEARGTIVALIEALKVAGIFPDG